MYISKFKNKYHYSERIRQALHVKQLYPDRIPIICENTDNNSIENLKIKYLVPKDFTVGNFIYSIRKQNDINGDKSVFIFLDNNVIPRTNQYIRELYNEYRDDDMFLYITYCYENTFGKADIL